MCWHSLGFSKVLLLSKGSTPDRVLLTCLVVNPVMQSQYLTSEICAMEASLPQVYVGALWWPGCPSTSALCASCQHSGCCFSLCIIQFLLWCHVTGPFLLISGLPSFSHVWIQHLRFSVSPKPLLSVNSVWFDLELAILMTVTSSICFPMSAVTVSVYFSRSTGLLSGANSLNIVSACSPRELYCYHHLTTVSTLLRTCGALKSTEHQFLQLKFAVDPNQTHIHTLRG